MTANFEESSQTRKLLKEESKKNKKLEEEIIERNTL